jgi:hypothetical protein
MKFIAAIAPFVAAVSAHGGVGLYVIEGTTYQGYGLVIVE